MVLIETTASEINKAEKWKWWLWFPWAWCGICEAAANCGFMSLFQVPAHYRHTESLIRTHALMEDSSKALSSTRDMLNLSTPNSSSLNGMFHRLYPPQLPLPAWWMVEKLDLTNNQCFFYPGKQLILMLQPEKMQHVIVPYMQGSNASIRILIIVCSILSIIRAISLGPLARRMYMQMLLSQHIFLI